MKKLKITLILILSFFCINTYAQEKYGTTVNLGLGIGGYSGYYRNIGYYLPVVHLDVEFDVARNFTLAPYINFASATYRYHLSNPSRDYIYKVNIIPVGVKASYYLDELLQAGPKWDFYAAASLGFQFRNTVWESGYYGDQNAYQTASPLYLDAHVGAEYHMTEKAGLFLDLSTGVSTFGLAIHF